MHLKSFTAKQYQKFSRAKGSQFIASEYALLQILNLIEKFKSKNILEVGAGIGTISDSILKRFKEVNLYATEADNFCLEHLPGNLDVDYNKLNLYSNVEELPKEAAFDLVIVDGKEEQLSVINKKLSKNAIIVVEGDRKDQTDTLKQQFPASKFVHSISYSKNNTYSNRPSNHFQGGLKIIFTKPNMKQKLYWLKLKMRSKINFQLRKIS